MHPSDNELIRYARAPLGQRLPTDAVAVHVVQCDGCRDELALMEDWLASMDASATNRPTRSPFEEVVLRLLQRRPTVVHLSRFDMPHSSLHGHSLAADGTVAATAGLQHLATLYSEDPEVVLRVMHDPAGPRNILQLTADDPALTNHVYIHLNDPPLDFLTDERGIATSAGHSFDDPGSLSWRLKLPDATFMLKPLEASVSADESTIDLPNGDRIAIAYTQDSGGISLRVRPLRIHGQESIERVRVVVCQPGGRWQVVDARATGECVAANLSSESPIEIRLFVIE